MWLQETRASTPVVLEDFAGLAPESHVEEPGASFDVSNLTQIWRALFASFAVSFAGTGLLDILGVRSLCA